MGKLPKDIDLGENPLKLPKRKTYATKNAGEYKAYSEDTICSFVKTEEVKALGFTGSEASVILREFGYIMAEMIPKTNAGFKLPLGLGTLKVYGNRNRVEDPYLSKIHKKKIFYTNSHCDKLVFGIRLINKSTKGFTRMTYFKSSISSRTSLKIQVKESYAHFSVSSTMGSLARNTDSSTKLRAIRLNEKK